MKDQEKKTGMSKTEMAIRVGGIFAAVTAPTLGIIRSAEGFVPAGSGFSLVDLAYAAEIVDPIRNTRLNEAPAGQYIHQMSVSPTGVDQVWSYGISLRRPNNNTRFVDERVVGQFGLAGSTETNSTYGFDMKIRADKIGDYKGSGARVGTWITTTPGDYVSVVRNINGVETVVAVVQADSTGFAGVLLPEDDSELGIRIRRVTTPSPIEVKVGPLSKEDAQKPMHPSVIDARSPEYSSTLPVKTFAEVLPETAFRAKSFTEKAWSRGVLFTLPQHGSEVAYYDGGNVGEMFVQTNGTSNFDLYMNIDPFFINELKQGLENRPAAWIKTQQGALIQLLDKNRRVIAEVRADGAGYGGVVLPDYLASLGLRIVLSGQFNGDTKIQFGPERPADKGKSSTLDSTLHLKQYNDYLPSVSK